MKRAISKKENIRNQIAPYTLANRIYYATRSEITQEVKESSHICTILQLQYYCYPPPPSKHITEVHFILVQQHSSHVAES